MRALRRQLSHPSIHCLLVSFNEDGLVWFPTAHVEGAPLKLFLPSSLLLSPQGVVWIYPLLRASTEHILIVRPQTYK
jgi:hypothetical protein